MALPRLIAWIEPEHRAWLETLVAAKTLELVAIGTPRAGTAAALGTAFGVDVVPDVRQAVLHGDADALWLAARVRLDADERRLIRDSRIRAVSSEPRPLLLGDLIEDPAEAATAVFVPLMRRSPGWLAARDALREVGPPQALSVEFRSGPGHGSLLARLFDALDVVAHCCGEVEQLDAALSGVLPGVPEDDATLAGHLTVNLRFPDRRCGAVTVSDRGGAWSRRVTLLAENAALTITDDGFTWQPDDAPADEQHQPALEPGALVGRQIVRLLQGLDANDPPPDTARLLALCETARLSARTGQCESPSRVLEMLTRV